MEETLVAVGIDFAAILREGRFALPIVKIEAEFYAPLRHGDTVTLVVGCTRIGKGSFTLVTEVRAGARTAARVVQTQAAFDLVHKMGMALPEAVRQGVARLQADLLMPA